MPHYLVTHDIKTYPESQDAWIDLWRRIRSQATDEVEWLHSFFEPETQRMYCEWRAPDSQAIIRCLPDDVHETAPVISASEIVIFDLAWLDERA